MLDWVPPKEQLTVMAHELTHALQDQYIGLQNRVKTSDDAEGDPAEAKGRDEPAIARRAVGEGQAMAVMVDYILDPFARTLTDLPSVDGTTLQKAMLTSTRPAFLRAPRYIRESETFPYTYGLRFVYQVLKKGGKGRAFAEALRNPSSHHSCRARALPSLSAIFPSVAFGGGHPYIATWLVVAPKNPTGVQRVV